MSDPDITGYRYTESGRNQSHGYLLPAVSRVLDKLTVPARARRLLELGCSNGSVAYELTRHGWDLTGIEPSAVTIEQAQAAHPELKLACGSAYHDRVTRYGQFPVVLSLDVVGHVYRRADTHARYYRGNGHCLNPFHAYWKTPRSGADLQDG